MRPFDAMKFRLGLDPHTFSLLHFDGNKNDEKGYVWTDNGTSVFSGTGRFGNAYVPHTSNYIYSPIADNARWEFLHDGTISWTIDVVVKQNSATGQQIIMTNSSGASANIGIYLDVNGGFPRMFISKNTAGTYAVLLTSPTALTAAAQNLISFQYDKVANLHKIFIEGTEVVSGTPVGFNTAVSSSGLILGRNATGTAFVFNGTEDELRFSKIARYSGNFTPPAAPYQN